MHQEQYISNSFWELFNENIVKYLHNTDVTHKEHKGERKGDGL